LSPNKWPVEAIKRYSGHALCPSVTSSEEHCIHLMAPITESCVPLTVLSRYTESIVYVNGLLSILHLGWRSAATDATRIYRFWRNCSTSL